jgi:uncharacterized protein (TIGR03118 family)
MRWTSACLAAGVLCACSGNTDSGLSQSGDSAASAYAVTNLVSDGAVSAATTDANLVNPWGIAFNGGGPPLAPVWVANNGTNTSTLYDGNGSPVPLGTGLFVFNIPAGSRGDAAPTGIVYNGSGDFAVSGGTGLGMSASFIFDGEAGTLAAWTTTNLTNAVTVYDDGAGGAIYKGLAIASSDGANFLYATDFHNAKVDVFDSSFARVASAGGFLDATLPAGYAPFGIQAIGDTIYVTYAQQAPEQEDEVDGAGLGFVDAFDTAGNFLRRVASNGPLNAPWGIALAPTDFGQFSGALLIGNFGDGWINAFDAQSGEVLGSLHDPMGEVIAIPGLWGIAFGNDVMEQAHNALFFAAGINDEADGLYGRIDLAQ